MKARAVSINGRARNGPGIHLWVGFRGKTTDEELKFIIKDFGIGGVVLFRRNIEGPEQLHDLLEEAQALSRNVLGRPLWVAIDQEGGPVQRLVPPFTRLPSAQALAAEGPNAVRMWAARAALELRQTGININLAPVLDVMRECASHFMGERCLGRDPESVAGLGKVWIGALQENGVSASAKHFPGLGQAESDPHHFAPVIHWPDEEARERDILPFREAVKAGVHCVMTSHALYPDLDPGWPATMSPTINDEWLRSRMEFQGVLLSDDLDMAAVSEHYPWAQIARQGVLATIDGFLLCQRSENIEPFYQALSDALATDSALADKHRRSLARLARLSRLHGIRA